MTTINWDHVEVMAPEDIENLRVSVIKEMKVMEDHHQIVKDEVQVLERRMITLDGEKKDLKISLSKSSHAIKQKKSDLEILTTKFWQAKR